MLSSRDWHARSSRRHGFTLIELLLVMGIISSLASIVIQAINLQKMLLLAHDASRTVSQRQLERALTQYLIENGKLPNDSDIPSVASSMKPICSAGVTTDPTCVNFDALVPTYIVALPRDTAETSSAYTGYKVYKSNSGQPFAIASHLGEPGGGPLSPPPPPPPPPPDVVSGRVGYWPLDEGAGATTADLSVNASNGVLYNSPAWVAGKFGNGLRFFTGTVGEPGRYVKSTAAAYGYSNGFTYAAWINPETTAGFQIFMSEYLPYFALNGANPYFSYASGGQKWLEVATSPVPTGQWTHLAGSVDATGVIHVYKNGALIGQTAALGAPTGAYTNHYIGTHQSTTYQFKGTVDEVRIYNRVLSAEEVATLAAWTPS